MKIQPIVEGHGDVQAVPVLLRRLLLAAGIFDVDVGRPIRQSQSQLLKVDGLRKAVRLAKMQDGCAAILILFEHEDGCPKTLGPQLLSWAQAEANPLPCCVALAHREFESWLLAAIESLRGKRDIQRNAQSPQNPEDVRGAKEAIERFMPHNRAYSETVDQAKLTAAFDMKTTFKRSRSFRHLVKAFGTIASGMSKPIANWPPADWLDAPSF